jgi:hypothetical protein
MSNMHAFHKQLSATHRKPGARQRALIRLTQVSRAQVLNIASDLIWYIWDADQSAGA